jgi:hypothetical protein
VNVAQAQKSVVIASLAIVGSQILFFPVAPAIGYPLEYDQAISVLQITLPVFLGYLGVATQFVFRQPTPKPAVINLPELLPYLLWGPLAIFALASLAAIVAFGVTNGARATPGSGMTVPQLSGAVTVCLSLLTVTTNTIVSYLFAQEAKAATT